MSEEQSNLGKRASNGCAKRPYVTLLDVASASADTELVSIRVDDDDTLVAGTLDGDATFGDVAVIGDGGTDAFVARLDECGDVSWGRTYGGAGDATVLDLALDPEGNAYLLGAFEGTSDFGFGTVVGDDPFQDAFVMKLDSSGDPIWWKHVAGGFMTGLDVTSDGQVIVAGSFEGEVSFGDATVTAGTVSVVMAKIDEDGDTTWAIALDTPADWAPLDVVADLAGGAFIGGADARGVGVFVISVGAGASVAWQKSFRAPRQFEEWLYDMAIAQDGLPVLVGHGFLTTGLDPTATPPSFVAKLDATGEVDWVVFRDEVASEIGDEPDGELLLGGDACTAPFAPILTCKVQMWTFSADGDVLRERHLNGEATLTDLAVDHLDRAHLAGAVEGMLNVGGAKVVGEAGDWYVARLKAKN